ncbi:MAG TPA: amidohydrolase family protein [Bauldia sp.]|nr:amidohydrolase family protein [Bauldia sp.]
MPHPIRAFVEDLPMVDVHEHHFPKVLDARDVDLLRLFSESYATWTRGRTFSLPSEAQDPKPAETPPGPTTWEALAPYLTESGSNSFVRNLVRVVTELYGDGDDAIDQTNWERLDAKVRDQHARPDGWSRILDRGRIGRIITDPYVDPMIDASVEISPRHASVLRINAFACGWNPEAKDHNGTSAHELLDRLDIHPQSFDDYVETLEELVAGAAGRHQVALKNALAYDRHLDFDEPDVALARSAWGKKSPTAAERKAFSDFVVDTFCRLAGEHDLPVQMHLGSAIIRGSHPLNAAGLIERHPRTRFLLMHLAYPWARELLGMALIYRNVWLDLCWAPLLSPTLFKTSLHEAIEVLPDESRMMIGGDNWHAEETYGAMTLSRRILAEVLEEKIVGGYFTAADAERLAPKVLSDNAVSFFGLGQW